MGVSGYSVEIVSVSEVPKKFVGEPFSVSLISVSKKFGEEGVIKTLRRNFLVSQCRKLP